jgi:hypothetical protein
MAGIFSTNDNPVYTWTVKQLDVASAFTSGGTVYNNVVRTVHWIYQINLTSNAVTYSTDAYGSIDLDDPTPENFTAYGSLTKNIVVSWLENQIDVAHLQSQLIDKLNVMYRPTVVSVTDLPFSN